MFCQIGNREYSSINSPSVLSYAGENANIAEFALVNQKPRIQHTGVTLQTISMQFKHRVEFTNITDELSTYKAWKINGSVLPILMGNGEYLGDFLLKSSDYNVIQTLHDGTPIEVSVTLEFVEYVPFSKDEKQAKEHRKNALAIDSRPSNNQIIKESQESLAHKELMLTQAEVSNVIEGAKNLKPNSPLEVINKLKNGIDKVNDQIEKTREKILEAQNAINGANSIRNSLVNLANTISSLKPLLNVPLSLTSIDNAIVSISNASNSLSQTSLTFTTNAILRKF